MQQIVARASLIGDEVKNVSEDLLRRRKVQSRSTHLSPFLFPESERVSTAAFRTACTHHPVDFYGAKITLFSGCLAESFCNLPLMVSVTVVEGV